MQNSDLADRYNIAVENAFSILGDIPEDPEEAWSITRDVVVVRSKAINHLHLAVVLMSTVGLSSLFSFVLRTRLAYDVSTKLELASEHSASFL